MSTNHHRTPPPWPAYDPADDCRDDGCSACGRRATVADMLSPAVPTTIDTPLGDPELAFLESFSRGAFTSSPLTVLRLVAEVRRLRRGEEAARADALKSIAHGKLLNPDLWWIA